MECSCGVLRRETLVFSFKPEKKKMPIWPPGATRAGKKKNVDFLFHQWTVAGRVDGAGAPMRVVEGGAWNNARRSFKPLKNQSMPREGKTPSEDLRQGIKGEATLAPPRDKTPRKKIRRNPSRNRAGCDQITNERRQKGLPALYAAFGLEKQEGREGGTAASKDQTCRKQVRRKKKKRKVEDGSWNGPSEQARKKNRAETRSSPTGKKNCIDSIDGAEKGTKEAVRRIGCPPGAPETEGTKGPQKSSKTE